MSRQLYSVRVIQTRNSESNQNVASRNAEPEIEIFSRFRVRLGALHAIICDIETLVMIYDRDLIL